MTEPHHREKRGAIEGPIRIPLHSLSFLFSALVLPIIPSTSLKFRPVVFSIPTAPTNHPSDWFYKRRSQEKTHLLRLEFFLLLSPLDRARSVLTCRAMCSVAGPCDPVGWVFSTSGFHRFLATNPVSSETSKPQRPPTLPPLSLSRP